MAEETARRRNEELVSQLEESGTLTDPAVAAAFRSVLRHRFLPGRDLAEVYEDAPIATKSGEDGAAVSSSSQPGIMALMLQQLRVEPGQRVLEIGAGTGYNAALLSRLVEPDGRVVTLDIDEDLCTQARTNLVSAGVQGVEVVSADGAGGWPPAAPFHRIMVTASVADIAPAWWDQLVDGGRLVLPLGLAGPFHACAVLVKRGRAFSSESVMGCGFLPLRGSMGFRPEVAEADEQLRAWLAAPAAPTGTVIPIADLRAGFLVWLALTEQGFVRTVLTPDSPPVFGVADERGLALLLPKRGGYEVQPYGDGQGSVARILDAHRDWTRSGSAPAELRITAYPRSVTPAPEGERVIERPNFTFAVSRA
jgi:protein-L-isoaspartate(D-aspartate) O-methyltransferase